MPQEVARLWDWQHRRAAAGLGPELSPDELVAKAAAKAAAEAEARRQRMSAEDELAQLQGGPAAKAPAPAARPAAAEAPQQRQGADARPASGILGIIKGAERRAEDRRMGVAQRLVGWLGRPSTRGVGEIFWRESWVCPLRMGSPGRPTRGWEGGRAGAACGKGYWASPLRSSHPLCLRPRACALLPCRSASV